MEVFGLDISFGLELNVKNSNNKFLQFLLFGYTSQWHTSYVGQFLDKNALGFTLDTEMFLLKHGHVIVKILRRSTWYSISRRALS